MRRPPVLVLVVALVAVGLVEACGGDEKDPELHSVPARSSEGLQALATPHGLTMGAAARADLLADDTAYRDLLVRQYGEVTTLNSLKWARTQAEPADDALAEADDLVDRARAAGLTVHGHPLIWHREVPGWVTDDPGRAAERLDARVTEVVEHFAGRVASWDVVNEAVDANGELRTSFWYDRVGPEYPLRAFRAARAADPEAVLVYNDFGTEVPGPKADGVYDLVSHLAMFEAVDAVGFQVHTTAGSPTRQELAEQMRRYTDLGLEVRVSELDVRIPVPPTAADLAAQADTYAAVLGACLDVEGCTGVTTWGFTDAHSWIPEAFPGFGAALPFDADLAPKPAFEAMAALLRETPPG